MLPQKRVQHQELVDKDGVAIAAHGKGEEQEVKRDGKKQRESKERALSPFKMCSCRGPALGSWCETPWLPTSQVSIQTIHLLNKISQLWLCSHFTPRATQLSSLKLNFKCSETGFSFSLLNAKVHVNKTMLHAWFNFFHILLLRVMNEVYNKQIIHTLWPNGRNS